MSSRPAGSGRTSFPRTPQRRAPRWRAACRRARASCHRAGVTPQSSLGARRRRPWPVDCHPPRPDDAETARTVPLHAAKLILFAASAGIAALTVYLLISGRNILIPIAIAVMAWYLINAIARGIGRLRVRGVRPPRWAALALTILAVIAAVMALAEMVSGNFTAVVDAVPSYQANLQRLIGEVAAFAGLQDTPNLTPAGRSSRFPRRCRPARRDADRHRRRCRPHPGLRPLSSSSSRAASTAR